MPKSSDPMVAKLRKRVRRRSVGGRVISYQLNLRGAGFGDLGQITIRVPGSTGWPQAGETVTEETLATSDGVLAKYAEWIRLTRKASTAKNRSKAPTTVSEACLKYIKQLEEDPHYGPDHNTTVNRRSACYRHIIPKWGSMSLLAWQPDAVREWLLGLEVTGQKYNQPVKRKAAPNTVRNIRSAMLDVWRFVYPDITAPFAGVVILDKSARHDRAVAAKTGQKLSDLKRSSYAPDEVFSIMAWAAAIDQVNIVDLPNIRMRTRPVTAAAIAGQLGLATRIQELMDIRRDHVDLVRGSIYVPGTKTDAAPRRVIIFDSFRPWVEWLLDLTPDDPNAYLFTVDVRKGWHNAPSKKTYQSRIARAERAAELKFKQECTHIFRDSFTTWTKAEGMDDSLREVMMGHGDPLNGISSAYLDASTFVQLVTGLQPDIRRHLKTLPSPSEVMEASKPIIARLRAEREERKRREQLPKD